MPSKSLGHRGRRGEREGNKGGCWSHDSTEGGEVTARVNCRLMTAGPLVVPAREEQTVALLSKCDIFRTVRTLGPDCRASLVGRGHLGVKYTEMKMKGGKRERVQVICYSLVNEGENTDKMKRGYREGGGCGAGLRCKNHDPR